MSRGGAAADVWRGGAAADVWIVTLSRTPEELARASALLSDDERHRASRFRRDADRDRYVAAHAALRTLLSARLAVAPAALVFAAAAQGKPFLRSHSLWFNLSHAADRAMIGIGDDELGVDIEAIEPEVSVGDIARARFSASEVGWMNEDGGADRVARFYRLWAIREAFVKALGRGLSALGEVAIELREGRPVLAESSGWRAEERQGHDGYAAAIVVRPAVPARWHTTSWAELAGG